MRPAFPSLMDRYIGRLMVVPFAMTLAISLMLLVLDKLLRLLNFVVAQSGSPRLVWPLLINIVPAYLSFAIVVGLLMSVTIVFRRLALSSELDVLRAAGVGYGRMLVVPVCFSLMLMCVNFAIIGFLQPSARYAYKQVQFQLVSGALGAQVHAGDFSMLGASNMLRVEHVDGGDLQGVFIRLRTGRRQLAIDAASAVALADAGRTSIVVRLRDGVLVESLSGRPVPRVVQFRSYDLHVPLPRIGGLEPRGGNLDELSISELARAVGGSARAAAVTSAATAAQLNFRLAQVATLLLLPFLALPLAVPPKRTSSFFGILVAILLLVFWYKVLQFSLAEATAGRIDPVLGIWLPFAIAAGCVAWLYRGFAQGTRDDPLGRVEAILRTLLAFRIRRRAGGQA